MNQIRATLASLITLNIHQRHTTLLVRPNHHDLHTTDR
jgi:hypothetical protein